MITYRICKRKFQKDLSGNGAAISGGRWNTKGFHMIYTSESRALCVTEIAVHIPLGIIPKDYALVQFQIHSTIKIYEVKEQTLPAEWNEFPFHNLTQKLGDEFLKANRYAVMKVPSAVVQGEFNYLLNPAHDEFKKIVLLNTEPFNFDKRLFKRL
ncbi:MAG: RES family NAD+ phosphorylase [Chitinophagales bacterium]